MMLSEREARMALAGLEPLGATVFASAMTRFTAAELWDGFLRQGGSSSWGRRATAVDLKGLLRSTESCGARFVIPGDDEWPAMVTDLGRAQVGQQAGNRSGCGCAGRRSRGSRGGGAGGARAASAYGEQMSTTIAADLAAAGRPVVSGLAFGIDAAAHRGALG
ncbi:hypothetical protein G7085_17865 [Tessaracoccus sp. HDW20]|uniref:DNA-processing protein DprA n=1 Tax=Tessaracoccus coleopterorum TaxID=2714950 RepID=UPI0018D469FF|nr:DNA-processing protein DprA [Tessaracoccus coleopterorum]NHB85800.1 hypothetical protein [Tessaracoccus coleopterorum]